jgi:hypothetical protein
MNEVLLSLEDFSKKHGIAIGIVLFIGAKTVKICTHLFKKRDSSDETKREFERLEEEKNKKHKEVLEKITAMGVSIEKKLDKLVSKELLESEMKALEQKLDSKISIGLIEARNQAEKAMISAKNQGEQAKGMKQQLRAVFEPMIEEYHKIPSSNKTKKKIANNVNKILDKYEE